MVISLRKAILPAALSIALLVSVGMLIYKMIAIKEFQTYWMGGAIHAVATSAKKYADIPAIDPDPERFQRPSSQPALQNPYSFSDFDSNWEKNTISPNDLHTPEDVILAYYGILREAANMAGYSGGCGTIGNATLPYPYAYELLASDSKKKISPDRFKASFHGIGHLTLLKLLPAYTPPGTPDNVRYHMIEVEAITGVTGKETNEAISGSHFAYYYGIVTTQKENAVWKIKAIDYFPEDFLCAPYHGWNFDATYLVPIIYQNWYHLIDLVGKVDKNGSNISVYASGGGKQYRFDFVRLSNGEDVLLHEMIYRDGKWVETNLLKDRDQGYKLSILNPNLKKA